MVQAAIEGLLRQKLGLDANLIGSSRMTRAVMHRLAACRLSDMETYWTHLQTSPQELDELIEEVVVPETWFFRDREPFVFLKRFLISDWLPTHSQQVLRILSVPCATGEEPYSIAITLLEAGLAPKNFHIDAADISKKALFASQTAIYGKYSFRGDRSDVSCPIGIPPVYALRERYFKQTEAGYQLCERVRNSVNFIHGNLLDPSFAVGKIPYDIIFCRNLLIYFDRSAKERAIQVLEQLLTETGLLFVGHSETGQLLTSRFVSMRHSLAFAYRKAGEQASRTAEEKRPSQKIFVKSAAESKKWVLNQHSPIPLHPLSSKPQESDPSSLSTLPLAHPLSQSSLLETARGLADQGRLEEATTLCETYLSQNRISAEAYVLLGLVRQAAGDDKQAEQCFNKAIYLEPNHDEALFHLALLKEHHGDSSSGAILWQRIQRLQNS